MTLNPVLGAPPIAPHARSADRAHKAVTSDSPRFDEALNDQPSRRRDDEASTREADKKPPIDLSLELLAAQVAIEREGSDSELDPENEFEAVLDQFLDAMPVQSVKEIAAAPQQTLSVALSSESDAALEPGMEALDFDAATPDANMRADLVASSSGHQTNDDADPRLPPVVAPAALQVPLQAEKRRATVQVVPESHRANVAPSVLQRQQPVELQALPLDEVSQLRRLDAQLIDRQASRDPSRGLPDGPKVNVLSFSASLPPVSPPPLGPTVTGLVDVMEADATWRSAALDSAQNAENRPPNSSTGVNTLRIQLNPAELGIVTARLTASGQQLAVEIQVETAEARQKLTSDSEVILKALRSIGYDVERVTITQASANASGNPQNGASSRDQAFQNMQSQGDDSTQNRGNRDDQKGGNHEQSLQGPGEAVSSRPGNDIYI